MPQTYQQQSRTKLIATIVTVLVVAGLVVVVDHLKSEAGETASSLPTTTTNQTTDTSTASTTPTVTSAATSTTSSSSYKDGTYTASGDYYVPHGSEDIKVSLTLQNGVITSSSITNSESDHDSAAYQEDFAAAYKNYVVGKSINGLQLRVISGASDTTQGFNDALSKIASQAKA